MKQIVQNAALAAIVLLFATKAVVASAPDCDAIREDELLCLACNIYHEARSEPEPGQYAVALVTINRVYDGRWPGSICEVVWQPWQFSWTNDRKSDKVHNYEKWHQAMEIANIVIESVQNGFPVSDITNRAYYYHADYVMPKWAPHKKMTIRIGNHLFYTDPPKIAQKQAY